MDFAKLEGKSEKQIEYAQDVRPHVAREILRWYSDFIGMRDGDETSTDKCALGRMLSESAAGWWIAMTSLSRYDFERQFDKYSKEVKK